MAGGQHFIIGGNSFQDFTDHDFLGHERQIIVD
jgi:hypothetical protein